MYYLCQGYGIVCIYLYENRIIQKVMKRFYEHFQEMLTIGQGTKEYILFVFRRPFGLLKIIGLEALVINSFDQNQPSMLCNLVATIMSPLINLT